MSKKLSEVYDSATSEINKAEENSKEYDCREKVKANGTQMGNIKNDCEEVLKDLNADKETLANIKKTLTQLKELRETAQKKYNLGQKNIGPSFGAEKGKGPSAEWKDLDKALEELSNTDKLNKDIEALIGVGEEVKKVLGENIEKINGI